MRLGGYSPSRRQCTHPIVEDHFDAEKREGSVGDQVIGAGETACYHSEARVHHRTHEQGGGLAATHATQYT